MAAKKSPPKKTTKKATKAETGPVLVYVGERAFRGAPARDLDEHDIARLAYRRQLASIGADGRRPDPRHPDRKVVEEVTAELTGSGLYTSEV